MRGGIKEAKTGQEKGVGNANTKVKRERLGQGRIRRQEYEQK